MTSNAFSRESFAQDVASGQKQADLTVDPFAREYSNYLNDLMYQRVSPVSESTSQGPDLLKDVSVVQNMAPDTAVRSIDASNAPGDIPSGKAQTDSRLKDFFKEPIRDPFKPPLSVSGPPDKAETDKLGIKHDTKSDGTHTPSVSIDEVISSALKDVISPFGQEQTRLPGSKDSRQQTDSRPGAVTEDQEKTATDAPQSDTAVLHAAKILDLVKGQELKAKEKGGFLGFGLRAIRENLGDLGILPLDGRKDFGQNPGEALKRFHNDPRFEVMKASISGAQNGPESDSKTQLRAGDIILDTGNRPVALMYMGDDKIASDGTGKLSDRRLSNNTYIVRLRPDFQQSVDSNGRRIEQGQQSDKGAPVFQRGSGKEDQTGTAASRQALDALRTDPKLRGRVTADDGNITRESIERAISKACWGSDAWKGWTDKQQKEVYNLRNNFDAIARDGSLKTKDLLHPRFHKTFDYLSSNREAHVSSKNTPWTIARDHLQQKTGRKPAAAEIGNELFRLGQLNPEIQLNSLKPGDNIKLETDKSINNHFDRMLRLSANDKTPERAAPPDHNSNKLKDWVDPKNFVDRVVLAVSGNEGNLSGRGSINWDDGGHGISVGIRQWNQKSGELPDLFRAWHDRHPEKFKQVFGRYADRLLDKNFVRRQNMGKGSELGKMLYDKALPDKDFKQVQVDLARDFAMKASNLANRYGLRSELGIALTADMLNQIGAGGMRRAFRNAGLNEGGSVRNEKAAIQSLAHASNRLHAEQRYNALRRSFKSDVLPDNGPPPPAPQPPKSDVTPPVTPSRAHLFPILPDSKSGEKIEPVQPPKVTPPTVPPAMDRFAKFVKSNSALSTISPVERNITLAAEAMWGKRACEYAGWENNALREAGGTCAGSVSGVLRLAYPGVHVNAGAWELGRQLQQNYGFKEDRGFRDNPVQEVRIAVAKGHIGMLCPGPTKAEKSLSHAENLPVRKVVNNGVNEERRYTTASRNTTYREIAADQFKASGIKANREDVNSRARQIAELNGATRPEDRVTRGSSVDLYGGKDMQELKAKVDSGFRDPKDKWDGILWYDNHGGPGGWGGRPPHSMNGYKFLKPQELPPAATEPPAGKGRHQKPYNAREAKDAQEKYSLMQTVFASLQAGESQSRTASLPKDQNSSNNKPPQTNFERLLFAELSPGERTTITDATPQPVTPLPATNEVDNETPDLSRLNKASLKLWQSLAIHEDPLHNMKAVDNKHPVSDDSLKSRKSLTSYDRKYLAAKEILEELQSKGAVPTLDQLFEQAKAIVPEGQRKGQRFYEASVPLWRDGEGTVGMNLLWFEKRDKDGKSIGKELVGTSYFRRPPGDQLGGGKTVAIHHNIEGYNGFGGRKLDPGWINQQSATYC